MALHAAPEIEGPELVGDEPASLLRSADFLLRRIAPMAASDAFDDLRATVADLVWEANTAVDEARRVAARPRSATGCRASPCTLARSRRNWPIAHQHARTVSSARGFGHIVMLLAKRSARTRRLDTARGVVRRSHTFAAGPLVQSAVIWSMGFGALMVHDLPTSSRRLPGSVRRE